MKGNKLDLNGKQVTETAQYRKNLVELITRLKKTKATIIWCMTTPVPEGSNGRKHGDAAHYNTIARGVMIQHDIMINELHRYISPTLEQHQRPANVHFTPEGSKHLAKNVAKHINKALNK